MFNKKIILSIFTLCFIGVAAASGTWAYISSEKVATNNLVNGGTLTLNDGDSAIAALTINNIVPSTAIQSPANTYFTLTNGGTGGVQATLFATMVSPTCNNDMWKDLVIYINGPSGRQTLYDGRGHGDIADGIQSTVTVDSSMAAGATSYPALEYFYQNEPVAQSQAGQFAFNINFELRQNVV
jgi:hypothetical protein